MTPEHRKEYFQRLHAEGGDFWNDPSSRYEHRKREAILTRLVRPHYSSALEVGCSAGLFSERLARRAARFLAVDISETAVQKTRALLSSFPQARARVATIPRLWPRRTFDLILLGEVLYYLSPAEIRLLARRCAETLRPCGEIVIVCYLGETETPLSGADAAAVFVDAIMAIRALEKTSHDGDGRYLHLTLHSGLRPRNHNRKESFACTGPHGTGRRDAGPDGATPHPGDAVMQYTKTQKD